MIVDYDAAGNVVGVEVLDVSNGLSPCRQKLNLPRLHLPHRSLLTEKPLLTEPINLLFLTTYVGLGGGETSLLTLVEAHVKHDARYQPHLLLPHDGQLAERWRANGWPVHFTPWRGVDDLLRPGALARFPVTGASPI